MDVGSTKHRVGACLTNVRAGSKQGDVVSLGMITADGEGVIDRLQANRMTMHATVDARIHFRGPVLSRVVSHDVISVEDAEAPYSGGRKRHANYRSSRRLKSRRINVNPRRLRGTRATRALSSAAADLREPAQNLPRTGEAVFSNRIILVRRLPLTQTVRPTPSHAAAEIAGEALSSREAGSVKANGGA